MARAIAMPKLSATMDQATVVAWHKAKGEHVSCGDIILEIETDKATLTIEAPVDGILGTPRIAVGQTASVGAPLVLILDEGESEPFDNGGTSDAEAAGIVVSGGTSERNDDRIPEQKTIGRADSGERVFASPRARRLARERGLDLKRLQGSGPQGRIVAADLTATQADSVDRVARARRQIASQVTTSRREIPAFSLTRWIDMEAVLAAIATQGRSQTTTDYFLWALARAIEVAPQFRSVWNATTMSSEDLGYTNIGIVVDTDTGIVIPTLSDVGALELKEMAVRRASAVAAARQGKLAETHLARASLSLSSLIKDDADEFEAIISPDQTAIFAVGRLMERVMPYGGSVAIRRGCVIKLSADHRHIDGRVAAKFIGVIAQVLEQREKQ
jgi:pyruvate dehydrogenase E2 component (dihydrolipoamide acetyltransferase)